MRKNGQLGLDYATVTHIYISQPGTPGDAAPSAVVAPYAEHDAFRRVSVWISSGGTTCAPALDGKHFGDGPETEQRNYEDPDDRLTDDPRDLGHLRS